jgi:phosphate transport system protein
MLANKIMDLKQKLLEMAALVEKMVVLSFEGINNGNSRYTEVMDYEQRVNQLEMEIEDNCIMMMALYHPEAKDLRVILMIYKINNDLERLGDQAVNIAESVNIVAENPFVNDIPELSCMMDVTVKMLRQSIIAYTNEDVENARLVCKQDEIVDSYNRRITNHLVVLMKENPLQIDYYLHLLRITKNLERIADLSTNIGEDTVYLVQGRVIKHHQEDIQTGEES